MLRKCKFCEKTISLSSHPLRMYCNDSCRSRAYQQRKGLRLKTNDEEKSKCLSCAKEIFVWKGTRKPRKFCCFNCYKRYWRRSTAHVKNCVGCERPFVAWGSRQKYCSNTCRKSNESRIHYQSSPEYRKRSRERGRKYFRERYKFTQSYRESAIRGQNKRRAAFKNSISRVGKNDLDYIRRRDIVCVYCGKEDEVMHFDHVMPIDGGGKDIRQNLVLACPKCNHSKSNKEVLVWLKEKHLATPGIIRRILEKQGEQQELA